MEEQWTIYKIDERNSNEIGQFEMSGLLEHFEVLNLHFTIHKSDALYN
jgi:hypothetical protein